MVGTHSKEKGMATAGSGSPSAKVPKEDQDGVDMMPQGDAPAEGRNLGSAAAARSGSQHFWRKRASKAAKEAG